VNRRSWQFGFLGSMLACGVLLLGCFGNRETPQPNGGDAANANAAAPGPLLITVVGTQETADVLKREWSARSEAEVTVRAVEPAEAADEARLNSDLVLFPTGLLGELAQADALLPLDEELSERDAFDQTDLLLLGREFDGAWGGRTLALPLGSALPAMVYRTDVFEQLKLDPPRTWEEFAAAATKLQEAAEAETLPEGVATAVLEPTETLDAARQFLVRAAAYARVPGRYSGLFEFSSMQPELTSPAFAKALDEYRQALSQESTEKPIGYAEASRRLLAGEAALGVTYLLEAPELESEEALERAALVAVAPVPGSKEYWQPRGESWEAREAATSVPTWGDFGMIVGIGRSVADRDRALRALESIVDAEIGTPVSASAAGTAPFRKSQFAWVARWTKLPATLPANQQYAAAIEQAQSAPDHLLLPRIPGRERYLEGLGEQVRLALAGEKATDAALADAAAAWEKITDEIGRKSQVQAYRASLGLSN
jgi:multiple sugar transport system substrate-binding protein